LNKDYRTFNNFRTDIPDTAGHRITVRVLTLPNLCFPLLSKTEQKKCVSRKTKSVNKFHFSGSVASDSRSIDRLQGTTVVQQ